MKIGIIKGGQLGKMLIQAAMSYAPEVHVLDNDPEAPCRDYCSNFILGDCLDYETVVNFGRGLDVVTLEYEHVNVQALEQLQQMGVRVYPPPASLAIIQDKGRQKEFFHENGIPTAEFVLIERRHDIVSHDYLIPVVQKTRKAGYDGKGIFKILDSSHVSDAFDEPSVLERHIDFAKEISVIVARDVSGAVEVYPAVELVFDPHKHLVRTLFAPADISRETLEQAASIARRLAELLGIVGVLAVEMFVLKDGSVLVNEIAPRPHNSGHHTIEANVTSQYLQHIRCIMGLPVGSAAMISSAYMVNLLGAEGYEGEARYEGLEDILRIEGAYIHLYGKKITRPYRKMGHVTIVDSDLAKAREKAEYVAKHLSVVA